MSSIEQRRLSNIERNEERLEELGLGPSSSKLTPRQSIQKKKAEEVPEYVVVDDTDDFLNLRHMSVAPTYTQFASASVNNPNSIVAVISHGSVNMSGRCAAGQLFPMTWDAFESTYTLTDVSSGTPIPVEKTEEGKWTRCIKEHVRNEVGLPPQWAFWNNADINHVQS